MGHGIKNSVRGFSAPAKRTKCTADFSFKVCFFGQKKQLFVDDQMLMAFFERLGKETEQEKINFRFVLALILMRKRILKYDETKNVDDQELWRLRIVGEKQIVELTNPHLDEEQIEQLSSQIGEILQTDL